MYCLLNTFWIKPLKAEGFHFIKILTNSKYSTNFKKIKQKKEPF